VASSVPGSSVAVQSFQVIGPHNASDTMLAAGLPRFSHIEKNTRGAVDTMARRIGCADQTEQPLILQRSIGERVTQPLIEPATRHIEETAPDGRIKLTTMGFDELVRNSDIP
jgi:hypothetical protein